MSRELLACGLLLLAVAPVRAADTPARPNILWITVEDICPNLGCYGDPDAITPNLDKLAGRSVRYTHAFSPAPVCAPSRSTLITGVFASSLGSHFMRCQATLPDEIRPFPAYLREAGYYCSNNSKEDYNFKTPAGSWDDSSRTAHWRKRKPGQPFFAVFNDLVTHESLIRQPDEAFQKDTKRLTAAQRHDPAKVRVPPYHPDTPAVRQDWARYHDLITAMDYNVADLLADLEKDGLADDTIVFFFSDHGVGLPRGKRWLYDAGLHVPLLIHFPKNWAHLAPVKQGTATDRLVSFADFGPTVLSLTGVKIPAYMQGIPFLGEKAGPARTEIHAGRDRMDERTDCSRCVREVRYKYIRNFMPWKPWAANIEYMNEMPTMKEYRRLAAEKKLTPDAAKFMADTKPAEELYDTEKDPFELNNLVESKEHQEILERLRKKLHDGMIERIDLGLIPEAELYRRSDGKAPYTLARADKKFCPCDLLWTAATAEPTVDSVPKANEAEQWWAIAKRRYRRMPFGGGFDPAGGSLQGFLKSGQTPLLRMIAADAYIVLPPGVNGGDENEVLPVLRAGLQDANPWIRHAAAETLDRLGKDAAPARDDLKKALDDKNEYVVRVVKHALTNLGEK
jgi:uncharacterized sulfatase